MDARTNGSFAPVGEGLYSQSVVLAQSKVVACLDDGPAQRCPYGLGTSCPIVEVGKRVVRRRWWIEQGVGAVVGLGLSALAIWLVHYAGLW